MSSTRLVGWLPLIVKIFNWRNIYLTYFCCLLFQFSFLLDLYFVLKDIRAYSRKKGKGSFFSKKRELFCKKGNYFVWNGQYVLTSLFAPWIWKFQTILSHDFFQKKGFFYFGCYNRTQKWSKICPDCSQYSLINFHERLRGIIFKSFSNFLLYTGKISQMSPFSKINPV